MTLEARLEAILFIAGAPVTFVQMMAAVQEPLENVEASIRALMHNQEHTHRGLRVVCHRDACELVTHPDAAQDIAAFLKEESSTELTKPALEALSIIAYRGPLTRPELEQIRGVQSSLILRNLMMRGLIEQTDDTHLGQVCYDITISCLKRMGLSKRDELPDYATLRQHPNILQVLEDAKHDHAGSTSE